MKKQYKGHLKMRDKMSRKKVYILTVEELKQSVGATLS